MRMKRLFATILCVLLVDYSEEYNSSLLFSKIVGGRRAKWQGNIHVVGIKCGNNYYGAGALISPKHVITSHQCVHTFQRPNFSNAYVAVGSLSSLNGTGHYFQDIIYGNADTEINFAIIYLLFPIMESDRVAVIPLLRNIVHPGTRGYVAGWGCSMPFNDEETAFATNSLKELPVTILSNRECNHRYHENLVDSQLCARSSQGPTGFLYHRDFGDPLVAEIEGERYLIGIVVQISEYPIFPAIYLRISSYYTFIRSVIAATGPQEEINVTEYENGLCDSEK